MSVCMLEIISVKKKKILYFLLLIAVLFLNSNKIACLSSLSKTKKLKPNFFADLRNPGRR